MERLINQDTESTFSRLCNILISCEFGTLVGRVAWGVNNCTGAQHAYASTTIVHPPSFKGTEVILNVWEPLVEPHCFSLAQLWLINTGFAFPYNSSDGLLNTIEAGWQVYYMKSYQKFSITFYKILYSTVCRVHQLGEFGFSPHPRNSSK